MLTDCFHTQIVPRRGRSATASDGGTYNTSASLKVNACDALQCSVIAVAILVYTQRFYPKQIVSSKEGAPSNDRSTSTKVSDVVKHITESTLFRFG